MNVMGKALAPSPAAGTVAAAAWSGGEIREEPARAITRPRRPRRRMFDQAAIARGKGARLARSGANRDRLAAEAAFERRKCPTGRASSGRDRLTRREREAPTVPYQNGSPRARFGAQRTEHLNRGFERRAERSMGRSVRRGEDGKWRAFARWGGRPVHRSSGSAARRSAGSRANSSCPIGPTGRSLEKPVGTGMGTRLEQPGPEQGRGRFGPCFSGS